MKVKDNINQQVIDYCKQYEIDWVIYEEKKTLNNKNIQKKINKSNKYLLIFINCT